MRTRGIKRETALALIPALALVLAAPLAAASEKPVRAAAGGKLVATGGVSTIEGAAGGGIVPWAVIGGYGSRGQVGANAFYTRVDVADYHLDVVGGLVGIDDRIELSFARQRFDTEAVGAALGLGKGYAIRQDVAGLKVRLFGDAVLDQDTWLPQVAAGVQYKWNDRGGLLSAIGARRDADADFYASATKLFLEPGILATATLRYTRANQGGILGFGGDKGDGRTLHPEVSVAWLASRNWVFGAEYRSKPDKLGIAKEDDWWDAFVAWVPNRHLSVTLAYANLGSIVNQKGQDGIYASLQIGF